VPVLYHASARTGLLRRSAAPARCSTPCDCGAALRTRAFSSSHRRFGFDIDARRVQSARSADRSRVHYADCCLLFSNGGTLPIIKKKTSFA
jgi:hypothetical protein